jgi:hypothetical protein
VAQGVRLLAVGVWDFVGIVSVLLGLSIVLVLWIAPFVGLGLAAYYVFRGRVSRRALRGAGRRDTARRCAWTRPDHGRNSPLPNLHSANFAQTAFLEVRGGH